MGKLILVRHGQSEANRLKVFAENESPLTDTGRAQAAEAAETIAGLFRPTLAVSSDFLRAFQTAEIIAQRLQIPLEVVPALQERNFGDLIGQSYENFAELIAADPTYDPQHPWTWVPPNGESMDEVRARVLPALESLKARHPDDTIVVVCHGIVMQTLYAHFTNSWETAEIPKNCAIVPLEYDADGFKLLVSECL